MYQLFLLIVHSHAYVYVVDMSWHKLLLLQNQNIFITSIQELK